MKTIYTKTDRLFDTANTIFLLLILLSIIYPLYFVLIASFSDPNLVFRGKVWLIPKGLNLDGYAAIIAETRIWSGYANTIFYTVAGSFFNVVLTLSLAYPLSQRNFAWKKALMIFLFIAMYFSGGLIPTYLLIKGLGLLNTRFAIIFVGGVSVFNVIITRTFLQSTIPESLYESAAMEGCGHLRYFFAIILPLSKPILAVLFLFYGVGQWNDYFKGLIYLKDNSMYPLQLHLRDILLKIETAANALSYTTEDLIEAVELETLIKYGTIIVSSLPLLILYPFLQKYFTQGMMIGSMKG